MDNRWSAFWGDGWNVFDFCVVVISIISLAVPSLPALNVLRLIRIFKMVRLFRKLTSLRILIHALSSSVIPVINSFVLLLLVSSVYAVVATDLFRNESELFADFTKSLFTLFQIASGGSWASTVARNVMENYSGGDKGWVGLFFVSYVLIIAVVMMNIVVAVLLDEFITSVAEVVWLLHLSPPHVHA